MEGMDLWTSMFSSDFDEAEEVEGDMALEGEDGEQYGNGNGNSDILDADDGDDDILDGEDNEREEREDEEEEDGEGEDDDEQRQQKAPDPDDDAIFDFELQPIVSIAEPPPPPLAPSSGIQRTSMGRPRSSEPGPSSMGFSSRPTTSQINATDENGVPINYELGVVYICPACGSEFRQQDHWKRHMNQMHKYNTLRGLNFAPVDRLYQRCQECHKRIAMHSRENLLKHKFTHLPFRCTKCYICKREYKYRQDLMVHLRMVHCDEVVTMMREGYNAAGRKTRVRESRTDQQQRDTGIIEDDDLDLIEVRNELLEPDADETSGLEQPTAQTEDSASPAMKRKRPNGGGREDIRLAVELCEDYIHYMCPDCGAECDTQAQWSQHIEFVHDYVSRTHKKNIIVTPNTMKSQRAHKISNLANPDWMHCKLCYKGYTNHNELVTHLLKQHHLESLMPEGTGEKAIELDDELEEEAAGKGNEGNGSLLDEESPHFEDAPRRGGRISSDDMYERYIDYLCPQCGKEFPEKKHWRAHVVMAHGMNDLSKLNFDMINERQLKCNECEKIITNAYGVQNAQQHRITHLPYKAYARCTKCHKSYTDRKGLVKHLATYHRLNYAPRKSGAGSSAGGGSVDGGGGGSVDDGTSHVPPSQKQPRKQIVTVANETYEIIYLDDVEPPVQEEENDFGEQMQAEEEEFLPAPTAPPSPPPVPRPPAPRNYTYRYKCVHCSDVFNTQADVRQHINDKHMYNQGKGTDTFVPLPTVEQNYIFLCPSCGMEYKTQFEWRRHINEVHNFDKRQYLNMRQLDKYRYQCTQCKDIVCNSKLKGLQDHHFRHLPFRLYLKCLVCGTCYNHKPNIAAHLRARHNIFDKETPMVVGKGTKQMNSRFRSNFRDKGRPSSTGPLADSPPGCSSSATSGTPVTRTLKTLPIGMSTRPAGLNTLEDSISYHNAVDLDFITYYCPKCNQNFDSHAFWRKHIVEQHNFNSREGLNFRQLDNHHYLCLECYKRVTVTHTKGAIGQLQSHKFRHLPHRSFKCLTCNGEFVRKQMFFKHLNRDTNRCDNRPRRNLDDEDAEPELELEPELEQEQEPAQGKQIRSMFQLSCPQCGDGFTTASRKRWRQHVDLHQNLSKAELLHMKKGEGDLYRCQDCDEELRTNRLRELQRHRFQHLPHPAYVSCQLCEDKNAVLHNLQELEQHFLAKHSAAKNKDSILVKLRELISQEELEDEEITIGDEAGQEPGPYMPLPPHLLDEGDDLDFEDQYLLG
ncbi:hypothetical protein KR009_002060 [Drosophila setifemur]|nr:hypothetical protein KR009_002060 [Drosophila setifemur]